jgi:hypothetical protein
MTQEKTATRNLVSIKILRIAAKGRGSVASGPEVRDSPAKFTLSYFAPVGDTYRFSIAR